ncbi:MAG: TylF/MycF/NovP-related O-methyltransferase [Saprospiraceae bacterium]
MNDKSFLVRISFLILTLLEKLCILFGFVLVRNTPFLPRKRLMNMSYRAWDFNRYSSLELVAHEIISNNIPGNVAELGVYQGVFASKINEMFADRKLYLFDTFEGFSEKDKAWEKNLNTSKNIDQDFSDTSVEYVLKNMKYRKNCIIKAGYFPESANDVEDTFCFVSIDTDLYQPIYEGLNFFFPRLHQGGCIFIHDFNNVTFPGARQAVMKFCNENQVGYFPLSDVGGTVVISK